MPVKADDHSPDGHAADIAYAATESTKISEIVSTLCDPVSERLS